MTRTTTIMALAGALTLLGCGDDAHSAREPADEAWPAQRTAQAANDDERGAATETEPASGETANGLRVREDGIAASEVEPVSGEAASANDRRDREDAIAANEVEPVTRQRASESEDGWPDFGIWDEDADVRISRREFLRGVDRSYPMWERFDGDADGSVSRREMVSGLYDAWRGEGALSGRDLRSAVTRWFGVDWSAERVDDAGVVSRAELDDFLDRHGVFEALDRDADRSLDPFELGLAFFEHWDLNDDGFIDEVEWITA